MTAQPSHDDFAPDRPAAASGKIAGCAGSAGVADMADAMTGEAQR